MYAVLALMLAGLASAQGFPCDLCGEYNPLGKYCCADGIGSDTHHCCSYEDYFYKGGFVDSKALYIIVGVGAVILLAIVLCCCCCCACCPFSQRRTRGAVYNSVALPQYQHSSTHHPAQYPPQPSSNPHLVASAPPAYPTLPKV